MRTSRPTTGWQLAGLLLSTALLGACALSPKGPPSQLHDGFDTHSVGTLRHAASIRFASSLVSVGPQIAASRIAQLAPGILLFFANDEGRLNELERRLVECAQLAEHEVNNKYYGGRPPRPEECREQIGVDECGNPITRRMKLGQEKHELALKCARQALDQLWPGPYSIEQRYRYYPSSQLVETVSADKETLLRSQKELHKLKGTIKPDVALHASPSGQDLLRSVLTLDFKFPCPDTNLPQWSSYSGKTDCIGSNQKEAYQTALGGRALMVSPRGIFE